MYELEEEIINKPETESDVASEFNLEDSNVMMAIDLLEEDVLELNTSELEVTVSQKMPKITNTVTLTDIEIIKSQKHVNLKVIDV